MLLGHREVRAGALRSRTVRRVPARSAQIGQHYAPVVLVGRVTPVPIVVVEAKRGRTGGGRGGRLHMVGELGLLLVVLVIGIE